MRTTTSPCLQPAHIHKEPCSHRLLTAVLARLSTYKSQQSATTYGYYPGGFFHLAKDASPTPFETTTYHIKRSPSPRPESRRLFPARKRRVKEGKDTCKCSGMGLRPAKSVSVQRKPPCESVVPKVFGFTGPLVSTTLIRKYTVEKSDKITVNSINVNIPTPKFKPGPVFFPPNLSFRSEFEHKKAFSQGNIAKTR